MSKYPTAAGMDPEDAGRALMSRSVKKTGTPPSSDNDAVLDSWRIKAERELLKALRVEVPKNLSENVPETDEGGRR